jgi:hypothetical protein
MSSDHRVKRQSHHHHAIIHTSIWNICRSHYSSYLLHRLQIGTQSAVHGKNLLVDDGGDGQTVETVRECLPQLDIIPAFTYASALVG